MITKTNLLTWLKEVDKKLKSKIIITAVGGTAMTLLGLKPSTIDIDFCIESKNAPLFNKLTKKSKFKIDLFQDGYIFSEQLPNDYIAKSNKIGIDLKNIELKTLSPIDIIITKIARYNERDEEDINVLFKTSIIEKKELETRFKQVKDTFAGSISDYKYHFDLIIKRHFSKV